jgi:hypothetical protein
MADELISLEKMVSQYDEYSAVINCCQIAVVVISVLEP